MMPLMASPEHHHIGRRAGIVGFFTFLSRIMGLVRDAVIAFFFGASAMADAFYVAFRIPNLLRRLTAEGTLTVAFIPVFTEHIEQSRSAGRRAASVIFTYLFLFLIVLVILGVLFAPYLVRLIAYGFVDTPEKFRLTVYLTRLMFPYILLVSLSALAMGILNSLKRFAAPASAPILLNVSIILGAIFLFHQFSEPTVGLAVGVLVGGVSQIALQVPFLKKEGMVPGLNFNFHHPALRSLVKLMIPATFGVAVYQVNVLIITLFASFLPRGSVSYLWYADRVTEFPLGIFAIAIATASLPSLSDHAARKDMVLFKQTLNYSLRGVLVIMIPSAVGLVILAGPIIRLLFQRGVFSTSDTIGTAGALAFFALGVPFVSGVRNLVPAFFALKAPKVPVATASAALVVNSVAAFFLMKSLLHQGLALSLAISASVNFSLLFFFLRKKIGSFGEKRLLQSLLRVLSASAVMGFITWLLRSLVFRTWMTEGGLFKLIVSVLATILVAVLSYLAVLKVVGPSEFSMLYAVLKSARRRNR
jgi:putative peptidoglycan lipid II flippase